MKVVGGDLSLTSTALALVADGVFADDYNIKSSGKKGDGYPQWCTRIATVSERAIAKLVTWHSEWGGIDLFVIEAPSHGSKFGNPHERAGLWWNVYGWAYYKGIPVVTVAPKTRAKYIAGSGNADKKEVLAAARERYDQGIPNDDVADAVGLADMGARHLGEPLVAEELLPASSLEVMGVVKWPA